MVSHVSLLNANPVCLQERSHLGNTQILNGGDLVSCIAKRKPLSIKLFLKM